MSTPTPDLPRPLAGTPLASRLRTVSFALIGLGLVAAVIGGLTDWHRFASNYLINFTLFAGVAVTGMFLSALQYVTRSGWSASVRRIAENFGTFLPWLMVLAVPVVLMIPTLYHWSHAEAVASDRLLAGKAAYLNLPFLVGRLVLYFLLWLAMFKFFVFDSWKADADPQTKIFARNRLLSAPFVIVYAITMSFFAIDLLMSLDPHWYSTIFGVYYFSGSIVATLALVIILAVVLRGAGATGGWITIDNLHDLAKLLFAFNVFWAYIAFSQYFLIWYANIPEETIWFLNRWGGGWQVVSIGIVFLHFVIPFALLLTRSAKRTPKRLLLGAGWLFLAHYLDVFYMVMPVYSTDHVAFGWMEIGVLALFSGLFLFAILRPFLTHSPVAVTDPYIREALDVHS